MQPLQAGEGPSILVHQQERHMPEFRGFYEVYDQIGNIPRPGVVNPQPTHKAVITGPMTYKGQDAIKHELEVVKAGIVEAGAQVETSSSQSWGQAGSATSSSTRITQRTRHTSMPWQRCSRASMRPWSTRGSSCRLMTLAWPTSSACSTPITVEEFRKHAELRIEATNWALSNIPEERVRYHTCWGSWHTPHTTDIPFKHIVDLLLKVKAQAYSVEAADVRHELDYQVWEDVKFPDGKIYIPGVIAHKTTTIEPPELVAHRIVRYANIMGRENVIAGTDCGYGNRVYPDIAWAKMKAMADGAALATRQLWPRSS